MSEQILLLKPQHDQSSVRDIISRVALSNIGNAPTNRYTVSYHGLVYSMSYHSYKNIERADLLFLFDLPYNSGKCDNDERVVNIHGFDITLSGSKDNTYAKLKIDDLIKMLQDAIKY